MGLKSGVAPTGAICTRGGVLRTEDPVISDAEFTDACLGGQCKLPGSRYGVAWNSASTSTPGEPWWPTSKGGAWSDYFATKSPNTTTAPSCSTFTGGVPLGLFTGATPMTGVARQPEYLIEFLSPSQDTSGDGKSFECPTTVTNSGVATADTSSTASTTQTLNMACYLFRITSRGFGPSVIFRDNRYIPTAEVVMQTYFHIIRN